MEVAVIARLLARPAEVGQAERDRAGDRRQLVVADEDDSAAADEPAEVDEVEKDGVEAVVAVDERQSKLRPSTATSPQPPNLVSWYGSIATWRAAGPRVASRPSQTNSVAIP